VSRLFVVRHGNTFEAGEAPRRIGARTDLPLTTAGREQTQALGRHFASAGLRFARALASPLKRTQATAAAILAALPDRPEIEAAGFLAEIDHGPDENRPEAEVVARIGAEALSAWDSQAIAPPGWIVDRESRIAAWRALAAATPSGADVLLVTSNGAARFALLALGLDRTGAPLRLRTGAFGVIEIGLDGAARLADWDVRPE
jgi:probable phosphoglycerate mutase